MGPPPLSHQQQKTYNLCLTEVLAAARNVTEERKCVVLQHKCPLHAPAQKSQQSRMVLIGNPDLVICAQVVNAFTKRDHPKVFADKLDNLERVLESRAFYCDAASAHR